MQNYFLVCSLGRTQVLSWLQGPGQKSKKKGEAFTGEDCGAADCDFCELTMCTKKLRRAVEVSVSLRAVLSRASQQTLPPAREQQGSPWELSLSEEFASET